MTDSGRIGSYRVQQAIGRGAMGTVYAATHVEDGSQVAIKTLEFDTLDEGIEQAAERFEREVMATSKLHHPGIIRVFESGQMRRGEGGLLYFAMELIEGETLHTALKRGPFVPSEAAAVVAKLADALNFAHGVGIVHRDIKPGNVFLSTEQRVVVADFGICKFLGAQAMTQGGVMGTLPFMAPEQILEDHAIDHRADVFALGSLLYTLLTRRYLRPPASLKSVIQAVTDDLDVVKVRGTAGLDARLVEIMVRALSKDIDARYQRARDLMNDLWPLATEVPPFGEARRIPEGFTGQRFSVDQTAIVDTRAEAVDPIADDTLTDVEPSSPITGPKRSKSSSRWYAKKRSGTLSDLSQRQLQRRVVREASEPVVLSSDDALDGADTVRHRDIAVESTGVQKALSRRRRGKVVIGSLAAGVLSAGAALGWLQARPLELHVASRPVGAQVLVDGKPRGQAPLDLSLPRLQAEIEVELRAKDRQTRRRELTVSLWTSSLSVDLELPLKPGLLDLRSAPAGAVVTLGGQALCRAPCRHVEVQPEQTHVLAIDHLGCVPHLELIKPKAGQSLDLAIELRPPRIQDLALVRLSPSLQKRRIDNSPIPADEREHLLLVFAGPHIIDRGAGETPRYQIVVARSGRVNVDMPFAMLRRRPPPLPGLPDNQNEIEQQRPPDATLTQYRAWLLQQLLAPKGSMSPLGETARAALLWWPQDADLHRVAALIAARQKSRKRVVAHLQRVAHLDSGSLDLETLNLAQSVNDNKLSCVQK